MASSQVPDYIQQLIRERAQAYGVDPALLSRVAKVESSYNPTAGASTSSAKGLFQFTNPTWRQYGRGNVYDPAANADAGARFTAANIEGLRKSGQNTTPGNVYLAHFLGLGGARTVLNADPRTPLSSIPSMRAPIASNRFLGGMTAGDVQRWAASKMGGLFDPATPTAAGTSTAPAALASAPATSLTPTTVGLDPSERATLAALQPAPGAAPAIPPAAVVAPAPTPRGIDQSSVDRTNVLNPADRAAVDAMYPPVVASAAPAPAAVPPPSFAGTPPQPLPGPMDVPPAKPPAPSVSAPPLPPPTQVTSVPTGSQEEADLVAAHADDQGGMLAGLLSPDEQASKAATFGSKLPGLLNAQQPQLPAPPELTFPGLGTMQSPIARMMKQAKQQQGMQRLATVLNPGQKQQQTPSPFSGIF